MKQRMMRVRSQHSILVVNCSVCKRLAGKRLPQNDHFVLSGIINLHSNFNSNVHCCHVACDRGDDKCEVQVCHLQVSPRLLSH